MHKVWIRDQFVKTEDQEERWNQKLTESLDMEKSEENTKAFAAAVESVQSFLKDAIQKQSPKASELIFEVFKKQM